MALADVFNEAKAGFFLGRGNFIRVITAQFHMLYGDRDQIGVESLAPPAVMTCCYSTVAVGPMFFFYALDYLTVQANNIVGGYGIIPFFSRFKKMGHFFCTGKACCTMKNNPVRFVS